MIFLVEVYITVLFVSLCRCFRFVIGDFMTILEVCSVKKRVHLVQTEHNAKPKIPMYGRSVYVECTGTGILDMGSWCNTICLNRSIVLLGSSPGLVCRTWAAILFLAIKTTQISCYSAQQLEENLFSKRKFQASLKWFTEFLLIVRVMSVE